MAALQHQSLATGADLWDESRSTAIALREQSLRLRALLQNGANESLYFRRRLPSYTMAVVSLTHLLQASLDLFRRRIDDEKRGAVGGVCVRGHDILFLLKLIDGMLAVRA